MNIKTNYASATQAITELDAVGKNIDDFFPCIKNAQMLRFFDSLSPNPFIKKSFAKIFS